MQAVTLARKHWFDLVQLIQDPPTRQPQRGYRREDQDVVLKARADVLIALGAYGELRQKRAIEHRTEERHLLAEADDRAVDMLIQRARARNLLAVERIDAVFGGETDLEIIVEDHNFNWLKQDFKEREDWSGSDISIEFRTAVDAAFAKPRKIEEVAEKVKGVVEQNGKAADVPEKVAS